jgi:stress response protein YsnF
MQKAYLHQVIRITMSEDKKTEGKKIVVVDGEVKITKKMSDDKKHFKQSNESY